MTRRTHDQLVAELRDHGFDEQADLLEHGPKATEHVGAWLRANDHGDMADQIEGGEARLTAKQGLHRSIQQIATGGRTQRVGSLRDVLLGTTRPEEDDR